MLDQCRANGFTNELTSGIAFSAIQIPQLKTTTSAVSMTRLSSTQGNKKLVELVERRDRLKLRWRNLDDRLRAIVVGDDNNANVVLSDLSSNMASITSEIDELNQAIKNEAPDFAELLNPTPVSLNALQGVLDDGAAAWLQFTVDNYTQLALVTKSEIDLVKTPLSQSQLVAAVEGVRQSVSPTALTDEAGLFDEAGRSHSILAVPTCYTKC